MLNEKLKSLRKKKGITQVNFANIFGVAQGTVGNWETGTRAPDYDMLLKIASYYGVSIDYLVGKTEYENPELANIKDDDLKVALFGGNDDVTDEMWDEVKRFADFIKQKEKNK